MTTMTIQRLTAAVAPTAAVPDAHQRVGGMLAAIAERYLDDALDELVVPPGEWCIRSVRSAVALDFDRPTPSLEAQWARTLMAALYRSLPTTTPNQPTADANVRFYPQHSAALGELLGCAAVRDSAPTWAWVQLGLVPADRSTTPVTREDVLDALRRHPAEVIPAVLAAVVRVGADALHRFLGSEGWSDLAGLVAPGAIVVGRSARLVVDRSAVSAPAEDSAPAGQAVSGAVAARRIAVSVAGRSALAVRLRQARAQVDDGTAFAWAVLVCAEVEPSALRRHDADQILRSVAELVTGTQPEGTPLPPTTGTPPLPGKDPDRDRSGDSTPSAPQDDKQRPAPDDQRSASLRRAEPSLAGRDATDPPDAPCAPLSCITASGTDHPAGAAAGLPDSPGATTGRGGDPAAPANGDTGRADSVDRQPTEWLRPAEAADGALAAAPTEDSRPGMPTRWAGLFFLLNVADDAGIPDVVLADPALAGRPLSWSLTQLAAQLLLTSPMDDPALRAFAGLPVDGTQPHRDQPPATSDELAALDRHLARWCVAVTSRLGRTGDPREVTLTAAARRGLLVPDPGWLDVHLPLDTVDTAVRRAGLDLDPGWLPWLGMVVRFRYE